MPRCITVKVLLYISNIPPSSDINECSTVNICGIKNNAPILQAHTHVPVTLVTGREEMEIVKVCTRTLKLDKLYN